MSVGKWGYSSLSLLRSTLSDARTGSMSEGQCSAIILLCARFMRQGAAAIKVQNKQSHFYVPQYKLAAVSLTCTPYSPLRCAR